MISWLVGSALVVALILTSIALVRLNMTLEQYQDDMQDIEITIAMIHKQLVDLRIYNDSDITQK